MVTQSELLVSRVLGLSRSDIRPMACSLDVLVELLFVERIPLGDILVTKHVYPKVARRLEKSHSAVARSTERMANRWWDKAMAQNRIPEFIGRPLDEIPSVCEILCYLAFFLYHGESFFSVYDDLDRLTTYIPFGA